MISRNLYAARTQLSVTQNRKSDQKFRFGKGELGRKAKIGYWVLETAGKNRKGCDIGCALAANSCEGADCVDARTVTALDATTAFAVPDPGGFLAKPSVFSGPEALPVARPG